MENASKALVMAGSVLISLMILGALLLMFNSLSSYQEVGTKNKREAQIIEFNNQYETYNRSDVRGSDLYSLLNRATDYNERKSTKGIQGEEIAFEPIKITVNFETTEKIKLLTPDDGIRLFKSNTYIVDSNENTFAEYINSEIQDIENEYGKESLRKLTTGISSIFIDFSSATDTEKANAIKKFNENSIKKKISSYTEITEGSQIREDIYKYYEFMQFKRAHFNCSASDTKSGVTYDQNTGRIVEMNFIFTGKIE